MGSTVNQQTPSGSSLDPTLSNFELELESIFAGVDSLNHEVTLGLIRNLQIPPPTTTPPPTDKEVLFPAYLLNLATFEMWNNGFVKESERFSANVMQSIQQEVTQYGGSEAINHGAFWLSNVHEMFSFVVFAEDWYEQRKTDSYENGRLLETVRHDLESLEFNIYHTWMKVLKKKLQKMVVPAIIESQSLPGFATNERNNTAAYSMDNLLSLFNNVYRAMKAYYLEDSIITQAVVELLRLVGVTAFNDLLMRRHFLSWKRGLQINYNITKIEEWCRIHNMPNGALQLEHLMQATKLLQLKKATLNDLNIIQDVCWMLSPNQIHELMDQYLAADYEGPINGEFMKAAASRTTEKSDLLLLTAVDMENSGPYEIAVPRIITALETYIPSWLQTPRLKRLTEIVSAQAIVMQPQQEEEHSSTPSLPAYVSPQQKKINGVLANQPQQEERIHQLGTTLETRNCVLCTETLPIFKFPALINCEHKSQVCADCYNSWIVSELDSKSGAEIRCPESGCEVLLKHAEVQQYAAPEVYAKFDDLSVREVLNNDPNFRWCRRAGCGSGQIHENGSDGNIFRCIMCGFKVCVVHDDTWHEGETCEEYNYKKSGRKERDQSKQEEASVRAISQLTKKCPGIDGKCGWNIEKNGGCDHMTCTKCRYEFCWICMVPYSLVRKKGNTAHNRSCKYHSSKIT